jgi:hypothetical protein
MQHFCSNQGGKPRYDIHNMTNFEENMANNVRKLREQTMKLAVFHKKKYLKSI